MTNWISVKERLPTGGLQTVLVYSYFSSTPYIFEAFFDHKYKKWEAWMEYHDLECLIDSITHWQPLPEPPEEE